MNRTAEKHLAAILSGTVTRTNVIGLRKLINASERREQGLSVSLTQCAVDWRDLQLIERALDQHRPRVAGDLHETGLALVQSRRYAKRFEAARLDVSRVAAFRLIRYDRLGSRDLHCVPVYRVEDSDGAHLFTFRNIPWQSGGDGPEIQGRDF